MSKSDLQKTGESNDLTITENIQSLEIDFILQEKLNLKDVKVITSVEERVLNLHLIGSQKHNYESIVKQICEVIASLNVENTDILAISWYFSEKDEPAWQQEFELSAMALPEVKKETSNKSKSSWWKGISTTAGNLKQNIETQAVKVSETISTTASNTGEIVGNTTSGIGKAIGSTTTKAGEVVVNTTLGTGKIISTTASKTGEIVVNTTSGVKEVIGSTTTKAGEVVVNTTLGTGKIISTTASKTGQIVGNTTSGIGEVIDSTTTKTGEVVVNTALGMGKAITSTAQKTGDMLGKTAKAIVDNPLLGKIIEQVDLDKAEVALNKLQDKYPEENSFQIAHHLMREKALLASGSGLASSLLPGAAAALIALDLTAVAGLQAEMVYQISGSYGLDLKGEERKSEVLSIFALALGSSHGIKAGLNFLRLTPVVGAVVGASANAAMIYSMGYAACKFYEAKLNQASLEQAITDSAEASEEYLKVAIAQEAIMDQILVHLWLAGNPDKYLSDLLPTIDQLNLSPSSVAQIQAIARKEKEAIPVESLLEQINQDFAVSLLAQCEQLAKADGIINDAEAKILALINQRLEQFEE